MPEAKRPLKVFLCHAHSDAATVRALYNRLTKDGVDAWLDKEKLLPGQDWEYEIRKAVRESDVVIVCLSNSSVTKAGYVQKEIRFALDVADEQPEGAIFIIPTRLEECEAPIRLSRWQWVNLFEPDGYRRLLRTLRVRADRLHLSLETKSLPMPPTGVEKPKIDLVKPKEKSSELSKPVPQKAKSLSHLTTVILIILIGLVILSAALIIPQLTQKMLNTTPELTTATSTNTETIPTVFTVPTSQTPYVVDSVLPCGHTPPDAQGNTRPNESELPEEDRKLFSSQLKSLLVASPNPKHGIRIEIRAIRVNAPIVQGDGWEQLKKGVGQHIASVNPGEVGNVVLCAYDDVYGEIFRDLHRLKKDDKVTLFTQENSYTYLVTSTQDVDPTLTDVMLQSPKYTLTLITAYPYLVDDRRFVVKAKLETENSIPNPTNVRIGIVSGHWGSDSGAVCLNENGNVTLTEAEINLKIATLVQQQLLTRGFNVDLLKEFDSRLSDYKGVALVSIHADSCDYINNQATGFKVAPRINSTDDDQRLTSCLANRYQRVTGLPLHSGSITSDMREYHSFTEINGDTPVAIIETGFLNLDYKVLTEQSDLVAQGIVDGLLCFINKEKPTL